MKKIQLLLILFFTVSMLVGFRMHDKDHVTTLADNDGFLVEDYSDSNTTKYTTLLDIANHANVGRAATHIVAANDSLYKSRADYICDGTADQVQIQSAIDALPGAGAVDIEGSGGSTVKNQGGRVMLLEGAFNISDAISLTGKQNIALSGQGPSTVINNLSTDGSHAIEAMNVNATSPGYNRLIIRDMLIQGNANSGDGIHMHDVNYTEILNVYAQSNGNNGISLVWDFYENYFGAEDQIISGCQSLFNGQDGISLDGAHETLISHCHVEENDRYGIYAETATNTIITGCSIEDNVSPYEIYFDSNTGSLITGNVIEGHIYSRIYWGRKNIDLTITGNAINGAILFERTGGTTTFAKGIVITGNTFWSYGQDAIDLAYIENCVVSNNYIGDRGTSTPSRGMSFTNIKGLVVSGNVIASYSPGIYIGGNETENTIISSNNLQVICLNSPGNLYGIELDSLPATSDNVVEGNTIQKSGNTTITDGIHIDINGQVSCMGNMIADCTNSINVTSGTITIKNNKGYATENSGTATILSGNTNVVVTHGLDSIPTTDLINVTPTNNLGSAGEFWISDVNATIFKINVDQDPGANATFTWNIGSY